MISHRSIMSRRAFAGVVGGVALAAPHLRVGMAQESTPVAEPIMVAATFSILSDWVARVGGDAIALTTIVPAGGDAHTFDPSPDQVAEIADSAVIFEIGLGFETWLEDLVASSGTTATRVPVSTGMELLSFDEETGEEHVEASPEADEHEHDEHEHGESDPHIWGDVANAINAVELIRVALGEAAPGSASTFDANAAAYTGELAALDTAIRDQVATLPQDQRKLVTTHDTFGYYAHAYGFEVVGTALTSLSTEGGDPSAGEIADLIEDIQESGVKAIFAENISNADLMETIAGEAGVELGPALYTDALGEPDSDGATYVAMMTTNTNTIVSALA